MRAQVYLNTETGVLTTTPQFPPRPHPKDHWIKPVGRWHKKRLERKVIEVTRAGNVVYKDQDGKEKICSVSAFVKWCDDCRAQAKRLKDWHADYDEDGHLTGLRPKSHTRRYRMAKRAEKKRKK